MNFQALEVIRKLKDVMPLSRACMLLRIIFPMSVRNEMKTFMEIWKIIIVAENNNLSNEGEKEEVEAADKNVSFDIKVDPEFFRKVEEAVSTVAGGTNTGIFRLLFFFLYI